ncbi:MAG: hypothetical protein IJD04_03505 [Desulfovibrionaceae bacterium]|nr:hypothetical protein [Desulfovibrionaceae bacterium]
MDIVNFDLSVIYTRPDGSYVINQGMYHVPNEGEYAELWVQVDAYARAHPELVQPEPVPEPYVPTLQDYFAIVDAATSAAILAGFDYDIDPGTGEAETLHFSYDNFDQQNFADTANACLLAQRGVEGLPATVTWNGYRNYTAEGGGELVRLPLDPQTFLALYTGGALAHKATQMEIGGQRKAMIEATGSRAEIATYLQEWGLLKDELA